MMTQSPSNQCGPWCWHARFKDENGRARLPKERNSITEAFQLADISGYLILGFYPCGCLGEMFIRTGCEGELVRGLFDGLSMSFSVALQHGAQPAKILNKYLHTRFNPSGFTGDARRRSASSVLDYIAAIALAVIGESVDNSEKEPHPMIRLLRNNAREEFEKTDG